VKVLAATTNPGKISEISDILSGTGITIVTPDDLGLRIVVEEAGTSFSENAITKALAWHRASRYPSLADDSGLSVDALKGRPGVLSARFAGPGADDRENCEMLLKLMEGRKNRKARFICVVALAVSDDTIITAEGEYEGIILAEPLGENGFGYDPVFFDPPSGKTFAQMGSPEKNARSHRRRALMSLRQKIEEQGLIR
jgi:XTP/dITP diphosphohydrolase